MVVSVDSRSVGFLALEVSFPLAPPEAASELTVKVISSPDESPSRGFIRFNGLVGSVTLRKRPLSCQTRVQSGRSVSQPRSKSRSATIREVLAAFRRSDARKFERSNFHVRGWGWSLSVVPRTCAWSWSGPASAPTIKHIGLVVSMSC